MKDKIINIIMVSAMFIMVVVISFILYLEFKPKKNPIYKIVDENTGVNYYISWSGDITPIYNADGSLYVTKGE